MRAISLFLMLSLIAFYIEGIYTVFADDYRYDGKHAVGAISFPPYALYIGIEHAYRSATIPPNTEQEFRACMNVVRSRSGATRGVAQNYCECRVFDKAGKCDLKL